MEKKEELSKKEKIIISTISSIGTVGLYTGGVNLAKTNPENHNPIFIGTIIISFISPYLLQTTTTYLIKKYNNKKKKQLKKQF